MSKENNKQKLHYLGHRKRVRDEFINAIPEQTNDVKLLEMILYLKYPRRDVKPLAKQILHSFGNIRRFISATRDNIKNTLAKDSTYETCSEFTVDGLYFIAKLIKELTIRTAKQKLEEPNSTILNSWQEIIIYLQQRFGNLQQEHFNILFLAANNKILAIKTLAVGTIDEVAVHNREIIQQAIDVGAVGIVLSHNHFSGNLEPSDSDKTLTLNISDACKRFNIEVLDHIIITNDDYFSFRENGVPLKIIDLKEWLS